MTPTLHRAPLLLAVMLLLGVAGTALAATRPVLKYQPQSGLTITGAVGTIYAVQWSTNLAAAAAWRCLKFLQLSNTSYLMPGTASANQGSRVFKVTAVTATNFVFIPPGSFLLGSPTNEVGRYSDEGPQTTVTFSQAFWAEKKLVTQQQYQSVIGSNPSYYTGSSGMPVEQVSWNDATNYCALRTAQEQAAGLIPLGCYYRLPTEAEWEYLCRAGTTTRFNYGDDPTYADLASHAWYLANSADQTHVVGQMPANAWGLYDMHGDVWEWCLDWYNTSYPGGSLTDPQGSPTGNYGHILRGGSWADLALLCRSACRVFDDPDSAFPNYGFRVVLVASGP
jgi:formylglycine-generating enzyme required for sulfatase activity